MTKASLTILVFLGSLCEYGPDTGAWVHEHLAPVAEAFWPFYLVRTLGPTHATSLPYECSSVIDGP